MRKDLVHQGVIRILNVYATNNIASKYTKQKLESPDEIIVRHLNTSFLETTNKQTKAKNGTDLNNTNLKTGWRDIHRRLHVITVGACFKMPVGVCCSLLPPVINTCAHRTQGFSRCSLIPLPTHLPFRTLPSLAGLEVPMVAYCKFRPLQVRARSWKEGANVDSGSRMSWWKVFNQALSRGKITWFSKHFTHALVLWSCNHRS